MRIRVLLVDDFPMIREGIAAALESDPGIQVVGQAGTGAEGADLALKLRPDVVILDMRMPETGGMVLLERLGHELPEAKVLVMTASEKMETLLEAMAAGAAGYVTKRATQREVCDAVITVHGGGSVIPHDLAAQVVADYALGAGGPAPVPILTAREQELLRHVSQGLTDKEIARRMCISPRTVQNQLARIRTKTGLGRRSELARWAVEHMVT